MSVPDQHAYSGGATCPNGNGDGARHGCSHIQFAARAELREPLRFQPDHSASRREVPAKQGANDALYDRIGKDSPYEADDPQV